MRRRFRFYRWFRLLLRPPSRPRALVHLVWGPDELQTEMIALEFIPQVGDTVEIETRNVADEPEIWRIRPETRVCEVTRVWHTIQIDYGNDVGPDSFQSVTVNVQAPTLTAFTDRTK